MATLLAVNDYVGISFFITSMALLASAIFFYLERQNVDRKWQLSMTVMVLVAFIAFVHYMYMRELWVSLRESPITYRYIDWFITVPLQIVEFYLILGAVTRVEASLFWKLFIASIVMLVAGYVGESGAGDLVVSFIIGMIGWLYILFQVFFGEASHHYEKMNSDSAKLAFNGLRWIVTVGWAIYPIGYVYGYSQPTPDIDALNIIYNFADFLNKIAFGMMIWYAASCDTIKRKRSTNYSRPGAGGRFQGQAE